MILLVFPMCQDTPCKISDLSAFMQLQYPNICNYIISPEAFPKKVFFLAPEANRPEFGVEISNL